MDGVDLLSVAKLYGVEYGTIRYWASRYNWQAVGRYQRRTLYRWDHVDDGVKAWQQGLPQPSYELERQAA